MRMPSPPPNAGRASELLRAPPSSSRLLRAPPSSGPREQKTTAREPRIWTHRPCARTDIEGRSPSCWRLGTRRGHRETATRSRRMTPPHQPPTTPHQSNIMGCCGVSSVFDCCCCCCGTRLLPELAKIKKIQTEDNKGWRVEGGGVVLLRQDIRSEGYQVLCNDFYKIV